MTQNRILYFLFFYILIGFSAFGQFVNKQAVPKKVRILFLLDASGSMLGKWDGQVKMLGAKKILSELVDSLKVLNDVELGLRIYGHQFDKKYENCLDSKLEVPFQPFNHDLIKKKLEVITPKGTTPIAYSLEQAAYDFSTEKNVRNIIILITDGIESCKGDPCAVSIALQKKKIFLRPFIIGVGTDKNFADAFGCMGQYYDAANTYSFRSVLKTIIKQSLRKTTVTVNLLDSFSQPTETNVNMTFINSATQEPVYDFVHYIDKKGMPDTLEIDPVLTYDLVINTVPAVIKKNVIIKGGEHNTITVKTPQGSLNVLQQYTLEYRIPPVVLIRQNGKQETLCVQRIGSVEKYLIGKYDLEILTMPRLNFSAIEIGQSKTTTINIPAPGLLTLSDRYTGYGSVYKIKTDGTQEWIYNFDKSPISVAMQPGSYKLVFKAAQATSSKYTDVQYFSIKSGESTNIKLFK